MAGGTDILVRMRRSPPAVPLTLIGIEGVPELQGIAKSQAGCRSGQQPHSPQSRLRR